MTSAIGTCDSSFSLNNSASTATSANRIHQILSNRERWAELALIISAIAITLVLSATGVLPAYLLFTAKISILYTVSSTLLMICIRKIFRHFHLESNHSYAEGRNFSARIRTISPFDICVKGPFVEELIYRKVIQGGLEWILPSFLPSTTLPLFALSLPLSSAVAIVATGALFSYSHLSNNYRDPKLPVLGIFLSSILISGPLYHCYGFPATLLDHTINNTFIFSVALILQNWQAARTPSTHSETIPTRV